MSKERRCMAGAVDAKGVGPIRKAVVDISV